MFSFLFGEKTEFSSAIVRRIVGRAAAQAAAAGPTAFLVGTDLPLITGIWTYMVCRIAGEHGKDNFSEGNCTKFVTAVLTAASAWMAGSGIVSKLIACTGIGLPLGVGLNSAVNAFYTYRIGKIFDRLCLDDSGWMTVKELGIIAGKQMLPMPSISEIRDFLGLFREFKSQ